MGSTSCAAASRAGCASPGSVLRARPCGAGSFDLGLEDHVDLLGYVEGGDLDRVYREADAFVLPSYFAEGFPLSVMEAMSYGLPVVTTPTVGLAPTTSSRARMPSSSLRDGPIWSRPP